MPSKRGSTLTSLGEISSIDLIILSQQTVFFFTIKNSSLISTVPAQMKYMTEPAENMLSNVIEFPTFKEDGDEQVLDAGNLCHSDLALLKKNDPFMYYSIQGIRSKADVLDQDLGMFMSSLSVNSHIKAGRKSASRYVKRKTRISYESYFSFSPDDIAELHGPSAKRQRPSSSDVDELLHKNFGIQPPSSGDNDRMFEDMLNTSLRR